MRTYIHTFMNDTHPLPDGKGTIRRATKADVPEIVRLHAEDVLGRAREDYRNPLPNAYYKAFEVIDADPKQFLAVLEREGKVIGTLQLTFLPGLTYQGGTRAQIEAVHIDERFRGQRLGEALVMWAVERSKAHGARLVQLTSSNSRTDAHRFYKRLGFEASHIGFKMAL